MEIVAEFLGIDPDKQIMMALVPISLGKLQICGRSSRGCKENCQQD